MEVGTRSGALSLQGERKTLGSMCPVIIKHDFPNEQQHYIDNVGSELSSTKKRFIYDRPNTAKAQRGSNSQSIVSPQSAVNSRKMSANLIHRSQTQGQLHAAGGNTESTSADLYTKLLEGNKSKKESRFVIKPARKLNTFSIHSALYKIKKQKEELDAKIRDLEDLKTNFNEMDFYLIANSGAVDYMFNPGSASAEPPLDPSNYTQPPHSSNLLQYTQESAEPTDNKILSLAEINEGRSALTHTYNLPLQRPKTSTLSSKKLSQTTALNKKGNLRRPATAKPTLTISENTSGSNHSSSLSRDQIEMLRGESRDESRDQLGSDDLEILSGCLKVFQENERGSVQQWGEGIERLDVVKESIEGLGEAFMPSVTRLLSGTAKKESLSINHIGAIQEEEDEDNFLHGFDASRNNGAAPDGFEWSEVANQAKQPQQHHQQFLGFGMFPQKKKLDRSRSAKADGMKRVQSATTSYGFSRPLSAAPTQHMMLGQLARPATASVTRPMTAGSRWSDKQLQSSTTGMAGSRSSHHALMSYGPVQVLKERITRNLDHLDVLASSQNEEKVRFQRDRKNLDLQSGLQDLRVAGKRLPISINTADNLVELVRQTQDAMSKFQTIQANSESHISSTQNNHNHHIHFAAPPSLMQVSLDNQLHQPNFFMDRSGDKSSAATTLQLGLQIQQSINYQMSGLQSNGTNHINTSEQHAHLDGLSQLQSTYSRATVDLVSMQKDQNSVKLLRPSTAKLPPSNMKKTLNVPVAESLAYSITDSSSSFVGGGDIRLSVPKEKEEEEMMNVIADDTEAEELVYDESTVKKASRFSNRPTTAIQK